MGIIGDRDGIKKCNTLTKRVGSLISVQEVRDKYLFGINIEDAFGNELPDSTIQQYIDDAVSLLEHDLDISITPVYNYVEQMDYRLNEYIDWGYMALNNYPVIQINKMEMVILRDETGEPEAIQEIPNAWIVLQEHDGIIRLMPNARFPAKLAIGARGYWFPELLRADAIPAFWRVTYDYGFEDGKVPMLVNQAIGLTAAITALIIGGNLVIGAGIASQSISLDGLSQSISTTASAENSAYSATIKEYQRLLFGATKDDPSALVRILRNYYKGQGMDLI